MSERYKVVEGSISAHCCFQWSVVDTETPHPDFRSGDEPDYVCECWEKHHADQIAAALNATLTPDPARAESEHDENGA